MAHRQQRKVATYLDGFNLYHGMRSQGFRRYYWLDLRKLVQGLLKPNQKLVCLKYFTSKITEPEDKRLRQGNYLAALEAMKACELKEGRYLREPTTCSGCQVVQYAHREKMTDVNIATAMLEDAYSGIFDTALLISGDSDLVPPVKAIKRLFPAKQVIVAFPPSRKSRHLEKEADHSFVIGRAKLAQSQLPPVVEVPGQPPIYRPNEWQ